MRLRFNIHKLTLPMLFVSMMLQRSPVIRLIAQSNISLIPRVQHVWTALVAAVTVGAYNSVTAASGKIEIAPGSTDTTVSIGEQFEVVLRVGGEKASTPFPPEIWERSGTLPAGLQAAEGEFGTYNFTGTPTEAGTFPITVQAWEKMDKSEGSNDTFNFTITVEGSGLSFTQQPPSIEGVDWDGTLNLSATVDVVDGTTYQWQRKLDVESIYSDIDGATQNTLTIPNVTTADSGMYKMIATNSGTSVESNVSVVTVTPQPGPKFTGPSNKTLPWGEPLSLSASVDVVDGTTYEWQRILSGEIDYSDINGETGNVLSLPNMTSADEGMYRLVATNGGTAYPSDAATVTVTTTPFQSWRENNFQDPFSADAAQDQDPDKDSLINLVEFTFGLDPLTAENKPLAETSIEIIDSIDYIVYTFPPITTAGDTQVNAESNGSLIPAEWSSLTNGTDGVIISSDNQTYVVKIPMKSGLFNRLKIVSN